MTAAGRRCLVVGATGLVGSALIARLAVRDEYAAVTALGRRLPDVQAPTLTHRLGDLDADDLGELVATDAAFCCLGTTIRTAGSRAAFRHVDYEMVLNVARQARAAGAGTFLVVSSLGADPASNNFYQRTKGEMEAAVSALSFDRLAIFRPSLLLGDRDELRPVEAASKLASRLVNPMLHGPLRKYRSIDAAVVAHAMIAMDLADFQGVRILESDDIARLGTS